MLRHSLIVAGLAVLAACAPVSQEEPTPVGPNSTMAVSAAAACRAGGGLVQRRGRMQAELCVQPFADAGKTCTDGDQCAGDCITEAAQQGGTQVSGQCQADDRPFGCFAKVEDGRATGGICID
ncbi:hypothetical protein PK98_05940 [Croceibacterium mercuriale]|uniref:Uncharacterized protein n=1 Tax=Croceibacterium mercuriale TaxID=1572751 RepID=A0A0B2C1B1_9SPHN|nr:hypothetical protein [Croceibacterium mercuriale]KHL26072.1 hypothetical protein PK98_05940 [Croceibacterium mercuriale]